MTQRSGAKIQLTGVTEAALIILMVRAAHGLFGNLPQSAMAAIAPPHHCPWPTSQERCGRGGARRNSLGARRPYDAELGREEGLEGQHDVLRSSGRDRNDG